MCEDEDCEGVFNGNTILCEEDGEHDSHRNGDRVELEVRVEWEESIPSFHHEFLDGKFAGVILQFEFVLLSLQHLLEFKEQRFELLVH